MRAQLFFEFSDFVSVNSIDLAVRSDFFASPPPQAGKLLWARI